MPFGFSFSSAKNLVGGAVNAAAKATEDVRAAKDAETPEDTKAIIIVTKL